MESKVTAKDFFLHLGAMIGLYASAIALANLLFSVINKAFPQITQYYYSYPNISLPVATLIIVFPLFILLSYVLSREYAKDAMKKETWIRRWSVYISLFVSGLILVGDLVTVLYKFLDGQELTAAFVLKALVVLALTALVFGYYVQDIREKIPGWRKRFWAIFTSIIVLASIILGFSVIGSPSTQRAIRYDEQKISDLQSIDNFIVEYYNRGKNLPTSLFEIYKDVQDVGIPKQYEYNKINANSYSICAEFNKSSNDKVTHQPNIYMRPIGYQSWTHPAGHYCFDLTIDPTLYPTVKN